MCRRCAFPTNPRSRYVIKPAATSRAREILLIDNPDDQPAEQCTIIAQRLTRMAIFISKTHGGY